MTDYVKGTFWVEALDRIVRTAAQTAAALIIASKVTSWFDIDWRGIGGVVLLAAFMSLLTSLGAAGFGTPGTPAIVPPPTTPDRNEVPPRRRTD